MSQFMRARNGVLERKPVRAVLLVDPRVGDPLKAGNLLKRGHLSAIFHANVLALVVRLLDRGGPSAISRRIVAVVVDAIKRCSWRPGTHIRHEGAEIIQPSRGYGNPATAVFGVVRRSWPCAATLHCTPGSIFRPDLAFARESVSHGRLSVQVGFVTPAALRVLGSQMRRRGDCRSAARADALPCNMTPANAIFCAAHNREPPEGLPGQIKQSHKRIIHPSVLFFNSRVLPITH